MLLPTRTTACLVLSALVLALASLTLLKAPTLFLWKLSVVAIEYGHGCFLAAVLLAAWGMSGSLVSRVGAAGAGVAAILFLLPAIRAWNVSRSLPQGLERAFGPLPQNIAKTLPAPFSAGRLWFGAEPPATVVRRLEYATHGGTALHFDFYPAASTGPSPCVLVLHTGSWESGSPEEFIAFNRFLAQRGYAVAALEYRLAPQGRWPAQREDTLDAIHYLQGHAAELGVKPDAMVLLGRSAGGQIAEAVACRGTEPGIRGCIAFYAPADLVFAFEYAFPDDILNSYRLLVDYLGGTLAQVPANYADGSGIAQVGKNTPPMLLLHGGRDVLVWHRQSERMNDRLREAAVPHYFVDLGWATHGFDYNPRGPSGQLSAYAVLYFLERVAPAAR